MLHQVGVGALGPVFRTYEPTRDRLVAVKVFRLDVTPEQAQALADELSIAAEAGLFHPSVVEPIAAGVEGTVAYRAEEYVAAETLDVALRHYAPAPIDKVLPLIAQLAGAIDFARTAGVGHGALHPRDVFVTPEEARVTGFGVVEALERVGLRAPVRRPYSAPERVSGSSWSTPADVFSLAAIAYELLTGRRPAGTGSQIGTVSGTSAGAHPGALHAVFVRAMDDNPSRRYQSAVGFAAALDAAARGVAPVTIHDESGFAGMPSAATAAAAAAVTPALGAIPTLDEIADDAEFEREQPEEEPEDEERVDDEHADDVLAEKEDDEAHASLLRYEADDEDEVPGDRSMFDSEALEDLALDVPAANETERFAEEFSVAAADLPDTTSDEAQIDEVEDHHHASPVRGYAGGTLFGHVDADDSAAAAYVPAPADDALLHDRPRAAMWPYALTLVVGLMIGAGGVLWFLGRFAPAEPAGTQATAAPSTATPGSDYTDRTVEIGKPAAPESTPTGPPPAKVTSEAPVTAPAAAPKPEPTAKAGRVVVSSSPRGAAVTLDGKWRGRTPLTLDDVPFGAHQLRVLQPGYATVTERVALSAGTPSRTLSFTLEKSAAAARPAPAAERQETAKPASTTGSIYVDSRPRGARVLLDGQDIGSTPMRIPDVKIGSRVIKLQLVDHRDWTSSTRVAPGQESRVTGSLERIR